MVKSFIIKPHLDWIDDEENRIKHKIRRMPAEVEQREVKAEANYAILKIKKLLLEKLF